MPRAKTTNSKKPKKVSIQKRSLFKKKLMIPAMLAFAIVGGYFLFKSFAATPTLLGNDGEFVAITPARMLDTSLAAGKEYTLPVLGKNGVPSANVKAVTINVTAAGTSANGGVTTADGYLTVYPSKESRPTASSVNFKKGTAAIANQITVKLGSDGAIKIFNSHGTTRIIVDVSGYYSAEKGTAGSRFVALAPARMLDTSLAAGKETTLVVLGKNGVPVSGVAAVSVNITAAGTTANGGVTTAAGYLTVFPSGTARPGVSSVNFAKGTAAIANQVEVKLGSDGAIKIFNSHGTTRIIVDVSGYYENDSAGLEKSQAGRFVPITPTREINGVRVGSGKTVRLSSLYGRVYDGANSSSVPYNNVRAYLLNITANNPSAASYLTAYPGGGGRPSTSSLNFAATTGAIANQVIVRPADDGTVDIYNAFGEVDVYIDVSGFYIDKESDYPSASGSRGTFPYGTHSKVDYDLYLEKLPSSQSVYSDLVPSSAVYTTTAGIRMQLSGDKNLSKFEIICQDIKLLECKYGITPSKKTTSTNYEISELPYQFAVGKYKITHQVLNDASGLPGRWLRTSITSPSGIKTNVVTVKYADNLLTSNIPELNINAGREYSCKSPQLATITYGNVLFDGLAKDTTTNLNAYAYSRTCPGIVSVKHIDTVKSSDPKHVTVSFGLPLAQRDTTAPSLSLAWDQIGHTLTVTASDNVMLNGLSRKDSSTNAYQTNYAKSISRTIPYNSSIGYSLGKQTVTYEAIDSSGNKTTKSIEINVTK